MKRLVVACAALAALILPGFPARSFKYTAAMQAAQTGDAPILLRVETKSGHGGGAPIAMTINEWADVYSFLVKNLDMTVPTSY